MLFLSSESFSQTKAIMTSLNTSGGIATGNSGSVNYSVGQVVYTYFGESNYNTTQGIQQANNKQEYSSMEDADIIENIKTELIVYPNPTNNLITLTAKGFNINNKINSYQLHNYQGQLLIKNSINQVSTTINLENFSSSIYILHVFIDNELQKTFKIAKNK